MDRKSYLWQLLGQLLGQTLKSTLIYLSIYDVTDAEKRVEITFEMLLR